MANKKEYTIEERIEYYEDKVVREQALIALKELAVKRYQSRLKALKAEKTGTKES